LPFFSGNRYPSRYSVLLLLCAAVLGTRGLLWLVSHSQLRNREGRIVSLLALVALLFAVEHISVPLPLNDFRIPPVYARLAAQEGDFALLELPTGWRNGARVLGKSDTLIMMQQWYQTLHAKRRLGGNTSRNPAYKFQYFSETPVLADLIALMNADRPHLAAPLAEQFPTIAARVRQDAPALFDLLSIRYITVHVEKSPPLLLQLMEEALSVTLVEEWRGADWTGAPSTIRLYAVDPLQPPAELAVDLASSEAQMYLAEGWSPLGVPGLGRFATRQRVELLLPPLPTGAEVTLTYARPTRVTYHYQGIDLGQQSGVIHTLEFPPQLKQEATARLTLRFDDSPAEAAALVPNPSPIGSTGTSIAPGAAILAQSAGEEVGDFAHIWINGIDYAGNERGYNLVALAATGEVLDSATFDTMLAGEDIRMAEWLNRWQEGTVIVGAAADSVATEDATAWDGRIVTALQRLGVSNDLRGKLRWSHAFIGVTGAPPASAPEDVQLIRPAAAWLGAPLSAPSAYGPLQSFTLTRD
jgi:hypothetical protein